MKPGPLIKWHGEMVARGLGVNIQRHEQTCHDGRAASPWVVDILVCRHGWATMENQSGKLLVDPDGHIWQLRMLTDVLRLNRAVLAGDDRSYDQGRQEELQRKLDGWLVVDSTKLPWGAPSWFISAHPMWGDDISDLLCMLGEGVLNRELAGPRYRFLEFVQSPVSAVQLGP